jgi:hypothetical protein
MPLELRQAPSLPQHITQHLSSFGLTSDDLNVVTAFATFALPEDRNRIYSDVLQCTNLNQLKALAEHIVNAILNPGA